MADRTIQFDTKHNHKHIKHEAFNAHTQRVGNFKYAGSF
jgi:hypothetical protein